MLLSTRKRFKLLQKEKSGSSKHNSDQEVDAVPGMNSASFKDITEENVIAPFIACGGPYATSNLIVRTLYKFSCLCLTPFYLLLDYLLSMFIHTTDEDHHSKSQSLFLHCVKVVLAIIGLCCLVPLTVLGFLIWLPLQCFRPRSFAYICPDDKRSISSSVKYERVSSQDIACATPPTYESSSRAHSLVPTTYSIVSANICLMPQFIARINNLTNSVTRGRKISARLCGETLCSQQTKQQKSASSMTKITETDYLMVPSWSSESLPLEGYEKIGGKNVDSQSVTSTLWSVTSKERVVCDALPGLADFLCLQEVFDSRATDQLIDGLRSKYPYIIYDVSWPIHDYRMTLLGSGLCIASRLPFVDISFKAFPDGDRDDKLCCKGLLMAKVHLGKGKNMTSQVGFLATTHLQAWSRSSASTVRCKQLACIDQWMNEFVERKLDDTPEEVLFNLLCGDFNFDRTSHFDQKEQSCSLLKNFTDPCIDETGAQHSWVIGTELDQKKLHDESARTPQGLQRMLVSELERHQYVASTMSKKSSLQRVGDGKRRIDYILYKECNNVSMAIKDYKFFTGLAALTDHLPVGMVFSCDLR